MSHLSAFFSMARPITRLSVLTDVQHQPLCLLMQDVTCRNKEPSSDKGFFGLIFAMLIVPAIVILGIAFGSGYMVPSQISLIDIP